MCGGIVVQWWWWDDGGGMVEVSHHHSTIDLNWWTALNNSPYSLVEFIGIKYPPKGTVPVAPMAGSQYILCHIFLVLVRHRLHTLRHIGHQPPEGWLSDLYLLPIPQSWIFFACLSCRLMI